MRYFEVASRLIEQKPNKAIPGYGLGQRHVQILLQFSMAAIFVGMNMALPIAIIPITHPQYAADVGITSFPNWTDQSLILVSTQAGYAVTQLFGSCISEYYGYHFVMPFSMFLCSIFCFILPVLTQFFGSQGLILCLMLQGASQGFSLPVIPDYLSRWVPTSERSSIGSFMFAANVLAAALSTKITAWISTTFLGWTFAYYFFGIMGFLWSYVMINFGRNAPETSNNISTEERDFIMSDQKVKKKMHSTIGEEVPWKKLFDSPGLLAIFAAHAGTFWALWVMTAEIPSYLFGVLSFKIEEDGDIVGDAYFTSWLFSFIISGVTCYLIGSKILSLNFTRKVAQSIASYLAAVCLIILGFLSDPRWVIFFINAIFSALTASFWGFMLNYNDILHDRSMITHIGGFIGTITTLIPALLKQLIVTDQTDRFQWSIMFWLTAAVLVLSNTAFFFYSSREIQEWDSNEEICNQVETKKDIGETEYLMENPVTNKKTYGKADLKEALNETEQQQEAPKAVQHEDVRSESESEEEFYVVKMRKPSKIIVYGIGVRHGQIALIFFMVVIMYILNMAAPIAIVAMTDPGTSPNPKVPAFTDWADQSLVLSSYYWGFAPTQLIGGPLTRKYGFKWFMVVSMIVCSLFSIWLPALVVKFGSLAMIFCLFTIGLFQGVVLPMLSDFVSKWAPVPERTPIGTFIFASKTLGTVFATELTGYLSSSWWGWPSAFYLYGVMGLIWSIFMIVLGCNTPDEHRSISQAELEYIKRGQTLTTKKIPWSKIMKSVPTWSTWISHIGIVWTIRLSTTEFPTYINRVLGFDVSSAGIFMAITYLVAYLFTFIVSTSSQYVINNHYLSTGICRKICNGLAAYGSSFFLVLLAVFHLNRYLALACIFFEMICLNASFSGYNINYNDLSPNFSGCLFGVGGISSTIVSFVPLLIVQFMVTNQASATQWGYAFLISAFVASVGTIFFMLRASGEVQDYDDLDDKEDEESRVLLEKKQQN
ncbi:uncharacterized protein LOC123316807 [Coccinella septempunctata]|uniref:uncharacterized protein LOC123316807 n=1 Tax=Coccinella septempunctata TaxID=41139 RepID=UPI001D07906D|nr:uncharacterized protein LOC123316807 [Coccinella septempunctata]